MNWTPEQRGLLLRLAEAGALRRAQLAQAQAFAALRPAAEEWRTLLDRVGAFGGALLLAAAAVFFVAYNWEAMHRFARLALAIGALAACCGGALVARPFAVGWRAALFSACVATGAVLALVGQTYQTGADVWELFAAWSALMLPFVLLSRSTASWALWLAVANLALTRALSQSVWWGFIDALSDAGALLAIAALNLLILLLFEALGGRLLARPARWMQRLAALGVLAPLCAGAMLGWWEREFQGVAGVFSLVAALAAAFYHRVRRDLPILALAVYGGIAVLAAGLAKLLQPDGFLSINLVGLFIVAASAGAGVWLAGLHREAGGAAMSDREGKAAGPVAVSAGAAEVLRARGLLDDAEYDRLAAATRAPWWLMLLQTLAAWVASLLILSSFMLPLSLFGDSAPARAVAGALLCAAALALFRRERLFTGQMALAFSLAGQALLVSATGAGWSAFLDGGRMWALTGALAAAAMMWPRTTMLHRSLCAVLIAFHAGAFIGTGPALAWYGAALAAGAVLAWMTRSRWAAAAHGGRIAALARGGALAALVLPAVIGVAGGEVWRLVPAPAWPLLQRTDVLSLAAGLVFVAVVWRLVATAADRSRRAAVAAAVALALLSQPAPGLLVAAALALACLQGGHRGLAALALAAAAAYVGEYYWRLDLSLLGKSALLAASGVVLLLLRHVLARPAASATGGGRTGSVAESGSVSESGRVAAPGARAGQ